MAVRRILVVVGVVLTLAAISAQKSYAQAFGVELQSNLMPAAGGMGGVGIARPQDVQSTLMLNPATLAQKKGTQFGFSGAWAEPTIRLDNDANLPLADIEPFDSKSKRPGSIVGNIALTQDFSAKGMPVTAGMGLLTASGLGVNYRDVVESNGTTAELVVLATCVGMGAQLTDRLSIGFAGAIASASMDGVFTGVSASTPDYNLRGSMGFTYDVNSSTTIGGFIKSQEKHTFDNFVRFTGPGTPFQDFDVSLPPIYGIGIANESLMNGRLLVGVDVSYLVWSEADFFQAIWEDQYAIQTGLQYTTKKGCKYRLGYVYANDASRDVVSPTFGPIDPQSSVDYIQALFPNINEHRLSGGIGMCNVLPGVDVDLFAGGQFNTNHDYGASNVDVASYWVGFGTTWRFGRGACCPRVPNNW